MHLSYQHNVNSLMQ